MLPLKRETYVAFESTIRVSEERCHVNIEPNSEDCKKLVKRSFWVFWRKSAIIALQFMEGNNVHFMFTYWPLNVQWPTASLQRTFKKVCLKIQSRGFFSLGHCLEMCGDWTQEVFWCCFDGRCSEQRWVGTLDFDLNENDELKLFT